MKFHPLVSQATAFNHHNVFNYTLLLSEGIVSDDWEPSNKVMLFLSLHNKLVSHFSYYFSLPPTLLPLSHSLSVFRL
jgi:hypothetical protein